MTKKFLKTSFLNFNNKNEQKQTFPFWSESASHKPILKSALCSSSWGEVVYICTEGWSHLNKTNLHVIHLSSQNQNNFETSRTKQEPMKKKKI